MTSPARLAIAVVGAGVCNDETAQLAEEVGRHLARAGALLVCGGLGGVMEAACRGASEEGGLTIGILPGPTRDSANPFVRRQAGRRDRNLGAAQVRSRRPIDCTRYRPAGRGHPAAEPGSAPGPPPPKEIGRHSHQHDGRTDHRIPGIGEVHVENDSNPGRAKQQRGPGIERYPNGSGSIGQF